MYAYPFFFVVFVDALLKCVLEALKSCVCEWCTDADLLGRFFFVSSTSGTTKHIGAVLHPVQFAYLHNHQANNHC